MLLEKIFKKKTDKKTKKKNTSVEDWCQLFWLILENDKTCKNKLNFSILHMYARTQLTPQKSIFLFSVKL